MTAGRPSFRVTCDRRCGKQKLDVHLTTLRLRSVTLQVPLLSSTTSLKRPSPNQQPQTPRWGRSHLLVRCSRASPHIPSPKHRGLHQVLGNTDSPRKLKDVRDCSQLNHVPATRTTVDPRSVSQEPTSPFSLAILVPPPATASTHALNRSCTKSVAMMRLVRAHTSCSLLSGSLRMDLRYGTD